MLQGIELVRLVHCRKYMVQLEDVLWVFVLVDAFDGIYYVLQQIL